MSKFLWDLENILLETDASDITQVVYSLAPELFGNLVSQYRGGATNFFHFDALGSTDRLTSADGSVTDNYFYEAFGNLRSSSGASVNPFKYVGKRGYYFDGDVAGHYVRARHYDPALGRFRSPDPTDELVRILSKMLPSARGMEEALRELFAKSRTGRVLFNLFPEPFEAFQPILHPFSYALNNPLFWDDPSGKGRNRTCLGICSAIVVVGCTYLAYEVGNACLILALGCLAIPIPILDLICLVIASAACIVLALAFLYSCASLGIALCRRIC
jgi:RHS repeat-associated protein